MDREFHKQLCGGIRLYFCSLDIMAESLPIILLTSLGDSWGRLATYQKTNEVYSTPSSVRPTVGVPFRASSSNSTIGSKYRVLPCQPLSRLGELFQGLDRVVSFPLQEETLGGKRRVNRTTKSSLRT